MNHPLARFFGTRRLGASIASTALAVIGALYLLFSALPAHALDRVQGATSYAGLSELVLESGPASIDARPAKTSDAVSVEPRDFPAEWRLLADLRGTRLVLRVDYPPHSVNFAFSREPRVLLVIPKGLEVELVASSGDVRLAGHEAGRMRTGAESGEVTVLDCMGTLEAQTSSGDLLVERHRGAIDARTSSGNVGIAHATGTKNIVTSSGDIELTDAKGDAEARANSGNLSVVGCEGRLAASTSSGSITVARSAMVLELESGSGGIEAEELSLRGSSRFTASSGSIALGLLNAASELSFDLESTSGTLSAFGATAERRLRTGGGRIVVTGKTSSGNQRYTRR